MLAPDVWGMYEASCAMSENTESRKKSGMAGSRFLPVAGLVLLTVLLAAVVWGGLRYRRTSVGAESSMTAVIPVGGANYTADGVRIHGAAPGEWSHDVDAVFAKAAEEKLPVLAVFTGSDWNDWHKHTWKHVIDTPEWKEWSGSRLMLAWINFPNDASLVPKEYEYRNIKLSRETGVDGYPTFVVYRGANKDVFGHISARGDATPASFIAQVARTYLDHMPGGVKASLGEADIAAVEAVRKAVEQPRKDLNAVLVKANEEYNELVKKGTKKEEMDAWRKASDAELAPLQEPVRRLTEQEDAFYLKAFDACLARLREETK